MPTAHPPRPVVLVIRDGWGTNPNRDHDAFNAVHLAQTPVADRLEADWPTTLIRTSGEDVGLPAGTMGNSEVGHQNIGAGRIVHQEVMRITAAIRDGSFARRPALREALDHVARTGGRLHLIGLLSDGRVHSDIEHLFALLRVAADAGLAPARVPVHVITDGRDVGPRTALGYLDSLEAAIDEIGTGRVASVSGRFYAMDRDHRWERVAVAYAAITGRGAGRTGVRRERSAREAIERYHESPSDTSRASDEFVVPSTIVDETGEPLGLVEPGDAAIFFNFRGDRPREIIRAFTLPAGAWDKVTGGGFDRGERIDDLAFVGMSEYETGLPLSGIVFPRPAKMRDILGAVVSAAGLHQLRSAETEKFPHVTFFLNDYREDPFPGELRALVPSPRDVATYDLRPEMSAEGVCEVVLARIEGDDPPALVVVNFANPDMVGHTGNLEAAIRAVETVDALVGRIVAATLARGGALVITADHGNAEQMWDPETDSPHTAHTTYDVPLHVVGDAWRGAALRPGGRLADVAPTVLAMMGLDRPDAMTGTSLVAEVAAPS